MGHWHFCYLCSIQCYRKLDYGNLAGLTGKQRFFLWIVVHGHFFTQVFILGQGTHCPVLFVSFFSGTISQCWHCHLHSWCYPISWPVGVAAWASSWPTALTWAFGSHKAFASSIATTKEARTSLWLACTCHQSFLGHLPSVVGLLVFQRWDSLQPPHHMLLQALHWPSLRFPLLPAWTD